MGGVTPSSRCNTRLSVHGSNALQNLRVGGLQLSPFLAEQIMLVTLGSAVTVMISVNNVHPVVIRTRNLSWININVNQY